MKKILSLALALLFVFMCGCNNPFNTQSDSNGSQASTLQVETDPLLTDAEWVGQDENCENHISFKKDGKFGNNCACGEPIGNADIIETYIYNGSDKTIDLYDGDSQKTETAKILFLDKSYLVLNVWGGVYTYANKKVTLPTVHKGATEHVNTKEILACLSVFGYENGKITVSSHDYDGDTPDLFKKFELEAAEEITFNSVSVTDDNGMVIVDDVTLPESEFQYIGDYYNYGIFEFNQEGKVTRVTFYGETVIQG